MDDALVRYGGLVGVDRQQPVEDSKPLPSPNQTTPSPVKQLLERRSELRKQRELLNVEIDTIEWAISILEQPQ